MKRKIPTRLDGMTAAQRLKKSVQKNTNINLHDVILFGSVARDETHTWSDIDIAVVCESFKKSKVKEARELYASDPKRDVRISIVVLHPEEMLNKYSTLVQEIKKDGISV